MSLQSDHFENLVRELRAKGITEESSRIGAQALGQIVRDSIIAPFKLAVADQNYVPPRKLKRSNLCKHAPTKRRRKDESTSKTVPLTSSTARLHDETSSNIRGAPSCTNTTIISTASVATVSVATVCTSQCYSPSILTKITQNTPSHTELSCGNSTTSPSLANRTTQERAQSNAESHEAATLSSPLSYAPRIDQPQQHANADCILPSTPLSSSALEGSSVMSTSAPLVSQHSFSVPSWYPRKS